MVGFHDLQNKISQMKQNSNKLFKNGKKKIKKKNLNKP